MLTPLPGSRVFAAMALFVVLGAPLLPVARADAAAWRFDHGHLAGAPVDHAHPWDHAHSDDAAHDHEGDPDAAEPVFTMDDEGTHAAEPRGLPVLLAVLAPPGYAVGTYLAVPTPVRPALEPPPPQDAQG